MKINQSSTAINNYHTKIKGSFEASQNAKVYDAIKLFTYCTIRMASTKTGIENSAVSRCMGSLRKQGLIKFAFEEKCQVSGIKADYWKVKTSETIDNTGQVGMPF